VKQNILPCFIVIVIVNFTLFLIIFLYFCNNFVTLLYFTKPVNSCCVAKGVLSLCETENFYPVVVVIVNFIFSIFVSPIFNVRCYANAVYAIIVCPSVCLYAISLY